MRWSAYTQIIAPFSGVITGRFADPGALITAGGGDFGVSGNGASIQPGATEGAGGHLMSGGAVLTMAEIDKMRIYVYVPEEEAGLVRIGTHALVTAHGVQAVPPIQAKVVRYANSLDLATRTMLTEIDLDNPAAPTLSAHVHHGDAGSGAPSRRHPAPGRGGRGHREQKTDSFSSYMTTRWSSSPYRSA